MPKIPSIVPLKTANPCDTDGPEHFECFDPSILNRDICDTARGVEGTLTGWRDVIDLLTDNSSIQDRKQNIYSVVFAVLVHELCAVCACSSHQRSCTLGLVPAFSRFKKGALNPSRKNECPRLSLEIVTWLRNVLHRTLWKISHRS